MTPFNGPKPMMAQNPVKSAMPDRNPQKPTGGAYPNTPMFQPQAMRAQPRPMAQTRPAAPVAPVAPGGRFNPARPAPVASNPAMPMPPKPKSGAARKNLKK